MTKLSVNINKLATLRNARGTNTPDLAELTQLIISYGAKGITVHPRPDERHIKYLDVFEISALIKEHNSKTNDNIEFNIEGYPNSKFLNLVEEIKPQQCTLVPDPPDALTSNSGWDIVNNLKILTQAKKILTCVNTRMSVFVDPLSFSTSNYEALNTLAPGRVEIYTEPFASSFNKDSSKNVSILKCYKDFCLKVNSYNIQVNAGHDLNTKNLKSLIAALPEIKEVSIGHALICDSLIWGLKLSINKYNDCLNVKS